MMFFADVASALTGAAGVVVGFVVLIAFLKQFVIIGRPNELLVFSGRRYTLEDGTQVGSRVVRGGRSLRIPVIERVDRMDMTVMPIDIRIRNAYAKGNIQIHVDAVAMAKIATSSELIHHAIERFLGKARTEIRQVVKETLEGTLRGVIAQLTPEEINHDRQKLAEHLRAEVADDLGRMGLQVDTFKIQHVADEVNYLDSIGRVRIAEVIRDAEMAESDAAREADQAIANADSAGVVSHERADASVAEKTNELERIRAELESEAKSEEERTQAASREAEAIALQSLQRIRTRLENLRLQADEIIPAQKLREATELRASGDAAIRAERGRAQAESLSALQAAWTVAGDHAEEIFLLQQIDPILRQVAQVTGQINVQHVSLIDGGDGRTLARHVGSYPAVVLEILERIRETVGIDIPKILASGAHRATEEVSNG
jgi:flotillin